MADLNVCLEALTTCALSSEYVDWFTTIAIVLITVVSGLAILFAASRVVGRKDLEAWVRAELYHTGVAAVWVIIIASVASTACSVTCLAVGEESPFVAASIYLSGINEKLQRMSDSLFDIAKDIRFASAFNYGFLDVFVSPWSGCDVIAGSYETLAVMLTPFIGSLILQQYMLIAISNLAFQILLPVGILLRLVPSLREAGAFIMAIAFSLYIVFPLTYVFAEKATSSVVPSFEEISSPGRDCDSITPVNSVLTNVGKILPQTVFFPALSTIFTIAVARALSKVFNYDFQELF